LLPFATIQGTRLEGPPPLSLNIFTLKIQRFARFGLTMMNSEGGQSVAKGDLRGGLKRKKADLLETMAEMLIAQ